MVIKNGILLKVMVMFILLAIAGDEGHVLAQKRNNSTPTTSAEAKKQQQAAEKDIRETERRIEENDRNVKKELTELGKLEGEIKDTQGKIRILNGRLSELSQKITSLETGIAKNEKELEKLRSEYLKAIKKMRVTRKNRSDLAFIFSSGSFNQALRRLRYLREFSNWKDRQSAEINAKIADLKNEKEALAKAKEVQNNSLSMQQANEKKLETQRKKEETLIASLKEKGDALSRHLAQKQAEANKLNGLVSNLIAQEQRKAEEQRLQAEKQRREEERRKEEQRKLEEQRITEEKSRSEAEREQIAQNSDLSKQGQKEQKKSVSNKEADKEEIAEAKPRQRKKKEVPSSPKAEVSPQKNESGTSNSDFANARKRAPRSKDQEKSGPSLAVQNKVEKNDASGGSFQDMKGRLPRPVGGSFKITSAFGRQSLPNMSDVEYDNPGIDAEVAKGAQAQAVFKGKVSGVYLLPGYNTVVIINHDGYYTVYGNIASAAVKVGDAVKAGQNIGTVVEDEDNPGYGTIHFEVWKNRDKLNPQDWIK